MPTRRARAALLMLLVLVVTIATTAATHAHGHCATEPSVATAGGPVGAALAVALPGPASTHHHAAGSHHQPAAPPVPVSAGHAHHHAGAAEAGRTAGPSHGPALGPMAECAHCTGGDCAMHTGCGTAGAPFAPLLAAPLRAPLAAAGAVLPRGPLAWRSAALAPPTPPPDRLG